MADTIGKAFEELDENEMNSIQGGGLPATVTVTPWSSAPCTIGAGVVSVASIIGTIIYTVNK